MSYVQIYLIVKMMTQQKRELLTQYKKQLRTLELKKKFLVEECQKKKQELDKLKIQVAE